MSEKLATEIVKYTPSPTAEKFHGSNAPVRFLMGCVGSGKTTAGCMEIFTRAREQRPSPDGVRRTRWGVLRNTYPELKSTTIKSWLDWFPESHFGPVRYDSPITHLLQYKLQDGTTVHCEVLFLALDIEGDTKKLLSLELTGSFINEAKECRKDVFDLLQSRVGRYPSKRQGGPSWYGVFMDSNPPDQDGWLYKLFEEERPEGFNIFKQPPGDSPEAENVENLPADYYQRLAIGKTQQWTDVFIKGKYGYSFDGRPVFPEYIDATHCKSLILENAPLVVGVDFGLSPAAVIGQEINGQWRILGELVATDMGAVRFGEELKRVLATEFNGIEVNAVWGDPAGVARSQTDESTPFQVLEHAGIHAQPAPTNDVMLRRETVANLLRTLTMTGEPALLVDPKCRVLRKGFAGAYAYKRVRISNDERYKDVPDKNDYSHVADALQYCLMGGGAGDLISKQTYPDAAVFRPDLSWVT